MSLVGIALAMCMHQPSSGGHIFFDIFMPVCSASSVVADRMMNGCVAKLVCPLTLSLAAASDVVYCFTLFSFARPAPGGCI